MQRTLTLTDRAPIRTLIDFGGEGVNKYRVRTYLILNFIQMSVQNFLTNYFSTGCLITHIRLDN